jgi:hypothetical protein
VLQASEGGSVSLGRSLYKVKAGGTPTPAPQVNVNPGGVPVMVPPTSVLTDRISRNVSAPSIRSSAIAKPGEVVLSKNTLIGLCLTAFACGIVTTLAIDRLGHTRASEHEMATAREAEPTAAPAPAPEPVPVPAAQPAAATPAAAAADPVVVKLPAVVDVATPPAPAASPRKPLRPLPAKPAPLHKKLTSDLATDSTPAPSPAPKKWVDPFEQ